MNFLRFTCKSEQECLLWLAGLDRKCCDDQRLVHNTIQLIEHYQFCATKKRYDKLITELYKWIEGIRPQPRQGYYITLIEYDEGMMWPKYNEFIDDQFTRTITYRTDGLKTN